MLVYSDLVFYFVSTSLICSTDSMQVLASDSMDSTITWLKVVMIIMFQGLSIVVPLEDLGATRPSF